MSRTRYTNGILEMSTKVISAKVSSEQYDELLDACNDKGCTISQFVKDVCFEVMGKDPEFSEVSEEANTQLSENQEQITELQDKITKLESDLSNANSTISKQNHTIKEFYELVPEKELCQRRFDKSIHSMKFCMY
jgi:peptidoglycan hydrolase CwlO-like protein